MPEKHIGKVVQVMGPVLDIRFKDGELPALLNAIEVENNDKKLIVEVAQHVGDNVVRCIAMAATDGLVRGADAVDTGEPIKVPSVTNASAVCSTYWVSRSTSSPPPKIPSAGPSTARPPLLTSRNPQRKFWRPASRSLT